MTRFFAFAVGLGILGAVGGCSSDAKPVGAAQQEANAAEALPARTNDAPDPDEQKTTESKAAEPPKASTVETPAAEDEEEPADGEDEAEDDGADEEETDGTVEAQECVQSCVDELWSCEDQACVQSVTACVQACTE